MKNPFKKFIGWSVGILLVVVVSAVTGFDLLSPVIITKPVSGTVTNAITDEPMPDILILSRLSVNAVGITGSNIRKIDSVAAHTDAKGRYAIPRHVAFKFPLLNWFASQGIAYNYSAPNDYQWGKSGVYGGAGFFMERPASVTHDVRLMPVIVNTALCDNPGGSFRPDPKDVENCKSSYTSMVLENRPEVCETIQCSSYDEEWCQKTMRDGCKRSLAELWQDVGSGDDCIKKGIDENGIKNTVTTSECLMAKAIKFKEPNYCQDIYIYNTKERGREGEAPSIFRDYLGYGSYNKNNFSRSDMSYRDACLTMAAYRLGDAEVCNQIVDYSIERNYCKLFSAQKNLGTMAEWKEKIETLFDG